MELTLQTLNRIIGSLPKNVEADKVLIGVAIDDNVSFIIERIGYETVYEADGKINTGILLLTGKTEQI